MTEAAYKLVILLKSRQGVSSGAFSDEWLELEEQHPLNAAGLLSHVFNRPLDGRAPIAGTSTSPYDAAVETWWARKNDAADWVGSREFTNWAGLRSGTLQNGLAAVGGVPQVIWEASPDGPATSEPVKVIVLPVAQYRLRFSEFADYWTGSHARLATSGPDTASRLLRLEDTPAPTPVSSRFTGTRYDGVGTITFASADALEAEFTSTHYRDVVAPDEPMFTNTEFSTAFLTTPITLR
ncbi:EthD domain-containing protein [Microbacterium foliorum]|uniref:EthD domain-containing protein n=1 Tax=Microbacterium foliorum TaxID=104336 RepID=UPI0037364E06